MEKTNVMRILDQKKIAYTPHEYEPTALDGLTVARQIGKSPDEVFKTLVAAGTGAHFVFIIPVSASLDLKKAAKAVGVKAVAMLRQKDLLPLTGYIHGGCSPIGMKKPLTTVIDETAQLFDRIIVSAGKVGYQVELEPHQLAALTGAVFADLITTEEEHLNR